MSDVVTPLITKPIVEDLTLRLAFYAQGQPPPVYKPSPMLDAGGQDTLLKTAAARAGDVTKGGTNLEALQLAMEDAHTAMALGRDAEHARSSRLDLLASYANDLQTGLSETGALQGLQRIGAERGDI